VSPIAEDWHADAEALRHYVDGTADAAVAWSVETHLPACSRCRDLVGHLLSDADQDLLAEVRADVRLPEVRRSPRHVWAAVGTGVLGPWWAWASLVAIAVGVLWLAGEVPAGAVQQQLGLTWVLALSPLVPVMTVAAIYGVADRDPTVGATARGGLELVIVRTTGVLAVTIPLVAATLWATGAGTVTWLLPGLGLCLGSLVLGSWIGVERASLTLTGAWVAVVGVAMLPRSALAEVLAPAIDPDSSSAALWLLLLAVASAALLARRHDFDLPGRHR
jgi:hypothetical protein